MLHCKVHLLSDLSFSGWEHSTGYSQAVSNLDLLVLVWGAFHYSGDTESFPSVTSIPKANGVGRLRGKQQVLSSTRAGIKSWLCWRQAEGPWANQTIALSINYFQLRKWNDENYYYIINDNNTCKVHKEISQTIDFLTYICLYIYNTYIYII